MVKCPFPAVAQLRVPQCPQCHDGLHCCTAGLLCSCLYSSAAPLPYSQLPMTKFCLIFLHTVMILRIGTGNLLVISQFINPGSAGLHPWSGNQDPTGHTAWPKSNNKVRNFTQRYTETCLFPYALLPGPWLFTFCLLLQVSNLTGFWFICIYYCISFCTCV